MPKRRRQNLDICQETSTSFGEEPTQPPHRFRLVSDLATAQDGVIATDQLHDLGIDSSDIARLTSSGYLHRIYRRAYAVGRKAIPERGHIRAAVISLNGRCIVSHRTAAYLWGLAGPSRPIQLTRSNGARNSRAGLRFHRVADLDAIPQETVKGLPVTSVARTLRDLAATVPIEDLEDLAAKAQRMRILSTPDLRAQELPNRIRPGAAAFRRLLSQIDPNVLATRSRMERRILRLCERRGLKRPRAAENVLGFEVDLLWPEERVIVEFDSRAYHTDIRAFERDHRRDARHLAAGYRTFRITYRMLEDDPDAVVAQIAQLLGEPRPANDAPEFQ